MALTIDDVSIFADGVDHAECICVHPDGSVWAGGEAGQIYRISADGSEIEEINRTGGFTLGIAFSPDASWLAVCDLVNKCVWKLDIATNKLEKFAEGAEGENFMVPNYPAFDSKGRLYVSDSGAFRQVIGKVCRFEPDGTGQVWHRGPFNFTNGLALSKNEDYLYVTCTWLPGVERVAINPDGSAGKREVYVTIPQSCPDGIAFDDEGNLYIGCYTPNAIYKVNTKQEITLLVDDWEAHTLTNPTNIAFGGPNFDQLFTANLGRWHISKINVGAKGLKLVSHR
ncbi:gluconolaconase [Mucilaginibacter hurinus]|uniref:Gluconolaconase n=1 Tax=Mucilaginibacter hurinus TaxID=2201324 RepID=A0A367GNT5_9SPHI|nr:SMP-30/gluconolactonase/LRE family protein [Mucilaginibacter hurinus]RCH54353.1 gluconolaconase [Mucilaginibacter hurinus]